MLAVRLDPLRCIQRKKIRVLLFGSIHFFRVATAPSVHPTRKGCGSSSTQLRFRPRINALVSCRSSVHSPRDPFPLNDESTSNSIALRNLSDLLPHGSK